MIQVSKHVTTGLFHTDKVTNATVTVTSIEGGGSVGPVNFSNGLYKAVYTTGPDPAVNRIRIVSEATITVPEIFLNSNRTFYVSSAKTPPLRDVRLKSGQDVAFDIDTGEAVIIDETVQEVEYVVYGVDIQLDIEPGIVMLDDNGYLRKDMIFRYNILPPEYNAIIADIHLYEIDENEIGRASCRERV